MTANRLANEHSPYLRQHQHNPVDWFPWGEAAFEKARREEKPIFLSIGYSTCYWCHVMEKDSFERPEVAEILNRDFVSIKVDREERPDVDAIYMDAVVGMTGHGGWPMSVFLTPDLKPFYGGTYFPHEQFISVLSQLIQAWTMKKDSVLASAESLTEFLHEEPAHAQDAIPPDPAIIPALIRELEQRFDPVYGGFSPAPKFPPSLTLLLLLRAGERLGGAALTMAEKTLQRMARGGLFDHLGGGFHRYSTDRKWLVPHFEKMLYDNALLATVYLEAFQLTKDELYLSVARETLNYVLDRMTAEGGGYFSAEDAGGVGKEGEYYVWSEGELRQLLTPEELAELKRLYGITSLGNFEDGLNIFNLQDHVSWSEKNSGHARAALEKLANARSRRHPPHRDEKVLTSWNGLMISAFARGFRVTEDPVYLRSAEQAAAFLRHQLFREGELLHRFFEGESGVSGMLNDYAYLIQGLLDLAEVSRSSEWFPWIRELVAAANRLFWDETAGCYASTSTADTSLLVRKRELHDGSEPSGNGVMAGNLARLHQLDFERTAQEQLTVLLRTFASRWKSHPAAFSSALLAYDFTLGPAREVVICGAGDQAEVIEFQKAVRELFLPKTVFLFRQPEEDDAVLPLLARGKSAASGAAQFFVCEGGRCMRPVPTAREALALMEAG